MQIGKKILLCTTLLILVNDGIITFIWKFPEEWLPLNETTPLNAKKWIAKLRNCGQVYIMEFYFYINLFTLPLYQYL